MSTKNAFINQDVFVNQQIDLWMERLLERGKRQKYFRFIPFLETSSWTCFVVVVVIAAADDDEVEGDDDDVVVD